jgi:phosphoglycolate phosphatase
MAATQTVYPGVVDGLLALQQAGLKLACLTNKPVGFARELLKLKGLDGFFSVVFGGDSFERKKPDPLPLLKTCESLGTVPARTLMIGDSSNDARAARAAGCPVVLVTYGYNHGEPVRERGCGWVCGFAGRTALSKITGAQMTTGLAPR